MKKFFAGVIVGAAGVLGIGAAEVVRKSGGIREVAANALCRAANDILQKKVRRCAGYAENDAAEERKAPQYDHIMFHSERDAELVLEKMRRQIHSAGLVTLDDYYAFCGQSLPKNGAEFKNWGWNSLLSAYVYSYCRYNREIVWEIWLSEPWYIDYQ